MSERVALFAYGSLVSATSATRTLGRPVGDPVPACLEGWQRRWSAARDNLRSEKTFARANDGDVPPYVVALNLEPAPSAGSAPNGVLLELEEAELGRLDRRELRYQRVEVTGAIEGGGELDRVFAYLARPEHHHPTPPLGGVAIAAYVREVETAFAALGPRHLELYRQTTERCPVEVVEAVLTRDSIPEGNPREW